MVELDVDERDDLHAADGNLVAGHAVPPRGGSLHPLRRVKPRAVPSGAPSSSRANDHASGPSARVPQANRRVKPAMKPPDARSAASASSHRRRSSAEITPALTANSAERSARSA